jgi:hypothetical protein
VRQRELVAQPLPRGELFAIGAVVDHQQHVRPLPRERNPHADHQVSQVHGARVARVAQVRELRGQDEARARVRPRVRGDSHDQLEVRVRARIDALDHVVPADVEPRATSVAVHRDDLAVGELSAREPPANAELAAPLGPAAERGQRDVAQSKPHARRLPLRERVQRLDRRDLRGKLHHDLPRLRVERRLERAEPAVGVGQRAEQMNGLGLRERRARRRRRVPLQRQRERLGLEYVCLSWRERARQREQLRLVRVDPALLDHADHHVVVSGRGHRADVLHGDARDRDLLFGLVNAIAVLVVVLKSHDVELVAIGIATHAAVCALDLDDVRARATVGPRAQPRRAARPRRARRTAAAASAVVARRARLRVALRVRVVLGLGPRVRAAAAAAGAAAAAAAVCAHVAAAPAEALARHEQREVRVTLVHAQHDRTAFAAGGAARSVAARAAVAAAAAVAARAVLRGVASRAAAPSITASAAAPAVAASAAVGHELDFTGLLEVDRDEHPLARRAASGHLAREPRGEAPRARLALDAHRDRSRGRAR